jgi:hypothetical protein
MSEKNAQEQLEEALIKNYFANLEFLKQFDNGLYLRIENLSQAIDSEVYPERYFLEFIKDAGDFDIYDSHTKEYLYKRNPKRANNIFVNSVKFDNSSLFSSLINEVYDLKLEHKNVNYDYESYEELEPIIINDMKEFTNVLKDDTKNKKSFKKFEKFIFMGTLLGRHILDIHKKIKSKYYFICENNLEIFRLSLFVINYSDLASDSKLTFSIMDDENVFIYKYQLFLEDNPDENYCIKYQSTNYNVSDMMHRVISTMYKTNPMLFDYTRVLYNLVKLTSKRLNSSKILTIGKKEATFNFTGNKPVLFAAAGPSLQDNILWLKEYQDHFIIVAIGASYKLLLANEIKPDIISTIEPSFWELEKHHFKEEDIKRLDDTIILASIFTPDNLTSKLNTDNIFYFEINSSFKDASVPYKGYSVGELTVSVLLHLGVKELYLLGTDLAINSKTGETHISEYKDLVKKDVKNNNSLETLSTTKTSFKDELISVKGNFEESVLTTRIFILSIFAYNQTIKSFKQNSQTVINLSNHGAYLEGTEVLNIENISINKYISFNKKDLNKQLKNNLNIVSESKLTDKELELVKHEINYYKELLQKLFNEYSLEVKTFEEFNYLMKNFSQEIRNIGYPTLMNHLMEQYSKFSNTYIFYCFNEKKMKNELKKLKEIKVIWLNQVSKLLNQYISYLEDMIK